MSPNRTVGIWWELVCRLSDVVHLLLPILVILLLLSDSRIRVCFPNWHFIFIEFLLLFDTVDVEPWGLKSYTQIYKAVRFP